jgi:hypothetical protein
MLDVASGQTEPASLLTAMKKLPEWSSERGFSKEDWEKYRKTGLLMQGMKPDEVALELKKFMRYCREETIAGNSERESVGYILLRVVFEVRPSDDLVLSKRWKGLPKANICWPVEVTKHNNKVRLVALYSGSSGPPHNLVGEYRDLARTFKFRDLQLLQPVSGPNE